MKTTKEVSILRNLIVEDMTNIPDFINTFSEYDARMWESIQDILKTISRLTHEDKLSDRVINIHRLNILENVDYIFTICKDLRKMLDIKKFISSCLDTYIGCSSSYDTTEGYYVAYNLTTLKTMGI